MVVGQRRAEADVLRLLAVAFEQEISFCDSVGLRV